MTALQDCHIQLLENLLAHVKASGGKTNLDNILAIDGKFISALSHGLLGPSESAIETLRSLKILGAAINVLCRAVKKSLSIVQAKYLPVIRHHGLLSQPVKVVSQIFRHMHADDAKCATESISLVNHYFRDVAINTPELWTHLTLSRNPKVFIERSKSVGLDVDLTRSPHLRSFLEMVAPEVERWTSLSILCYKSIEGDCARWMYDVLAGKTLAALRELYLEGSEGRFLYDHVFYGFWGEESEDFWRTHNHRIRTRHLYSSWEMPSLQTINSYNIVPIVQPATLTCLRLHFSDLDSYSWKRITAFLRSVPSLTELSFDFDWARLETAVDAGTEVVLPNVEILRFRMRSGGNVAVSETNFLASLCTPNLSELTVHVTVNLASQLDSRIDAIFPVGNTHWPSLETLDLTMTYQWRDDDEDDVSCCSYDDDYPPKRWGTEVPDDLFERLPTVRHLSIRTDRVGAPDPAVWNVRRPGLRTLCFRDCKQIETSFILDVGDIFRAPEFEILEIRDCEKVDMEIVRKAMPEGKQLYPLERYDFEF